MNSQCRTAVLIALAAGLAGPTGMMQTASAQCSSWQITASTHVGGWPRKFRQPFLLNYSARSYSETNNQKRWAYAAIWYYQCNRILNFFESPVYNGCGWTKKFPSLAVIDMCKVCTGTNNPGDYWRSCKPPPGPRGGGSDPDPLDFMDPIEAADGDDGSGVGVRSTADVMCSFSFEYEAESEFDPPVLTVGDHSEIVVVLEAPEYGTAPTGSLTLMCLDPLTGETVEAGSISLRIEWEAGSATPVTTLTTTGLCEGYPFEVEPRGTGTFAVWLKPIEAVLSDPNRPLLLTGFTLLNTDGGVLACPLDFDQSGFVDLDDYIAFVHAFEEGDDVADFDGTGFVDTDDFDAFVYAFIEGC